MAHTCIHISTSLVFIYFLAGCQNVNIRTFPIKIRISASLEYSEGWVNAAHVPQSGHRLGHKTVWVGILAPEPGQAPYIFVLCGNVVVLGERASSFSGSRTSSFGLLELTEVLPSSGPAWARCSLPSAPFPKTLLVWSPQPQLRGLILGKVLPDLQT